MICGWLPDHARKAARPVTAAVLAHVAKSGGGYGRNVLHDRRPSPVAWSGLNRQARAFRVAHAAWAVVSMASLGYIWVSALTRHRDALLWACVSFLSLEGVALIVGRGNCPFGPLQRRLGDPVPLFELVLPPRAAKAAIPVLTFVTVAGIAGVVFRPPRR
jgi:hypothetical protein